PAPAPVPGNLRARLTSFVGRESDMTAIRDDLNRTRLITLTGPGGSGKTRLAEQAAAALAARHPAQTAPARYADGAWIVELASLDHPSAVPGAVLSALGRRETALATAATENARSLSSDLANDATARLLEHCLHRRLLLVLDNCEHLVDAAAALAETLLAHCPDLTVLATSREPLGVPGETVRPVEPLPPEPAYRLFADRAAAARAGFSTSEDPEAVAEICRRLDGLPLAIELAAARLRSLTPRQIADRLDDRFRLLTSGSRTVLPRQQTLRAVVDWSWDLLDERERTVVRRLSVFSGGCTLPAAEQVCADAHPGPGRPPAPTPAPGRSEVCEDDVLDLLGALVDKSILVAEQPPARSGTGVRYRMLETIHEYARERAAERPEDLRAAERRHTAQILRFVSAARPRIRSAEQLTWLPRVEADLDNIRAVLRRALDRGDWDTSGTLVRDVGWFWWLRNYRDEGARWAERVLGTLPAAAADRGAGEDELYREMQLLRYFLLAEQYGQEMLQDESARTTASEILHAFDIPRPAAARFPGMLWPFTAYLLDSAAGVAQRMDRCVANCRRYGGDWELAVAILLRAHIRMDLPGGLESGSRDLPEVDQLARVSGDRWLLSQVSGLRAEVAIHRGQYEDARAECETALRYAQQLGAYTELPVLLGRIADIWYRQGDVQQAEKLARRAIEDAEHLGIWDAQTFAFFLRAVIAMDSGDAAHARTLLGETERKASAGTPPSMFQVVCRALDARIAGAEQGADEGVSRVREALRTGLGADAPEYVLAHVVLVAAALTQSAGHPRTAFRLVRSAERLRGDLAASVPELWLDGQVRAGLAPDAQREESAREPALSAQQALHLMDTLHLTPGT
ncbi:ATP-binding protein, partial [Streptomyces boncukensis]